MTQCSRLTGQLLPPGLLGLPLCSASCHDDVLQKFAHADFQGLDHTAHLQPSAQQDTKSARHASDRLFLHGPLQDSAWRRHAPDLQLKSKQERWDS